MTLLYPAFLWLLVPLAILWRYRPKRLDDTVHLLILALLILALARPVLESRPLKAEIQSRDIIVALDASYSMHATDIAPNRYRYAKETINQLLASNHTDNIMLIAFTTNPLLLSPPTTDHALVSVAMESLNVDDILTHGTSLKRLFEKIATLPIQEKTVLLMTDGGDKENLLALEDILRENDISLVILALGTTSGAAVAKKDGSLLKDSEGNLVISRINPQLETLARQTGGSYITTPSSPQEAASQLNDALETLTMERHAASKIQQQNIELYRIPILLAIILFGLLHTRAVKFLLPLALLWGNQANASIFDGYRLQQAYTHYQNGEYNASRQSLDTIETPSLQSQIVKANIYYKEEQYTKAAAIYRSIRTTSPKVKQLLYYHLGNCYAKTKAYEKAAKYYIKALQLGEDGDARYNLRLVALRKNEAANKLQSARPTSQGKSAAKTMTDEAEKKKESKEQQNSGGGGGGGGSKKSKKREKVTLLKPSQETTEKKQPLSSKVYDLINKGYVHEKAPW